MAPKKRKLPFDKRGGVVVLLRRMIDSPVWLQLRPEAKVLLALMQVHWSNDKPVAYGVREASQKIRCSKGTAMRCFKQLEDAGFVEKIDESLFDSRTSSKARTWRLTWMPFHGRSPTNEWEITSTGSKMLLEASPQAQK